MAGLEALGSAPPSEGGGEGRALCCWCNWISAASLARPCMSGCADSWALGPGGKDRQAAGAPALSPTEGGVSENRTPTPSSRQPWERGGSRRVGGRSQGSPQSPSPTPSFPPPPSGGRKFSPSFLNLTSSSGPSVAHPAPAGSGRPGVRFDGSYAASFGGPPTGGRGIEPSREAAGPAGRTRGAQRFQSAGLPSRRVHLHILLPN